MDSKRKANGAASPENDDRASKRRKLAVSLARLSLVPQCGIRMADSAP